LLGSDGQPLATWNTAALSGLPATGIRNDFAYNKFKPGPYGLIAAMGAMATISLPPTVDAKPVAGRVTLKLTDVNGGTFSTALESNP
jgi:thiosulfate dehydrogenase [quinone] large subunit